MALDNNQKINIALGIGVLVTLLLGMFLIGFVVNDDSNEVTKATSQNILVYSQPAKATTDSSYNTETKKSTLGQTLNEQKYQKVPTTTNNIEINIHTPIYSKPYYYGGYNKPYYHHNYNKQDYHNNYYGYNKYYNSYYPFSNQMFYYENSYGSWHKGTYL
jgi:hypothetical protein